MEHTTDVLVVGAGPTGLLLAGDLAAAGVGCVLVERRDGESNLSRAFAVHARTLEQLDARGLADDLAGTGARVASLRFFGGVRVTLSRLPTRFPYVLITPQYETERVLQERARACGADIRQGVEVVGLRQDSAGVDVAVRDHSGTSRLRARYVVGADGVHSTVRRALGLGFPGRSVVRSVMLADARLADPPPDLLTAGSTGDAVAFVVPFGDGWYRVIAWDRRRRDLPDDAPVDPEEIRDAMRRALGTDHGLRDVRWRSRFHSDERQVPRYRVGRVFLAGDAAHVHSPAGGLGMNTGLQDAANLGWKLAAAVHGWAPPDLLDTYHAERHPVGRQVLRASGALIRIALVRSRPLRAARVLLARTATGVPALSRRLTETVSGLAIAYPRLPGDHPLTGRRAPDIPLTGGHRLYEALRGGRFLLVTPPADGLPPETTAPWADRVRTVQAGGPTRSTVLVRPDGYIAWATARPRPAFAVAAALTRHCGTPAIPERESLEIPG